MDSDGKLFVNRKSGDAPSISLAIGDNDSGLHWQADGIIEFRSNAKQVGYWGYTNGRLFNCYFREPTGNVYTATGMMINGNGSNLYPGLGFHQPGVTAGVLYFTNSGEFKFRNINDNGYTNIYGGNLIADAGYLYSRYNGIEIKIGAENGSYVHFVTNPARSLYFANSIHISGDVVPYTNEAYALGNSGHWWGGIYGKEVYVSSWVRFTGASGVYWTAYSGGWTMNDTTYIRSYGGKSLWIEGNILANGGITAKTTSDMRLKNRVGQIDYAKKLLSLGLVFDYIYNDTAQSRIDKMVDDKRHIGLSYQAVSKVLPAICGKDEDGYGYINYISPDFISLIAGATQLNTLGIKELYKKTNSIEDEIKKLKKENECLKKEINKLKREYR